MQTVMKRFILASLLLCVISLFELAGVEGEPELLPLRSYESTNASYRSEVVAEEKIYLNIKDGKDIGVMVMEIDQDHQRAFFLVYSESNQAIRSGWIKVGGFLDIAPEILGRKEIFFHACTDRSAEFYVYYAEARIQADR